MRRPGSPASPSKMFAQKEAIVKLLQDDDQRTVDLVKEELARQGMAAIPNLQDLLAQYDERVTRHVRDVMGRIDSAEASEELTRRCSHFAGNDNLEEFCWLLEDKNTLVLERQRPRGPRKFKRKGKR